MIPENDDDMIPFDLPPVPFAGYLPTVGGISYAPNPYTPRSVIDSHRIEEDRSIRHMLREELDRAFNPLYHQTQEELDSDQKDRQHLLDAIRRIVKEELASLLDHPSL